MMTKKKQEVHFSAHVWTQSQTINLTYNMANTKVDSTKHWKRPISSCR